MARSLATSPWAPLVAVTSQRQVLLYNTTIARTDRRVSVSRRPAERGSLQPRWALLLAGGGRPAASGKVVVWDITTGERVFEVGNELDVVLAADISADHKRIALGGPQRVVQVYSTETGELLYELASIPIGCCPSSSAPMACCWQRADRNGGFCVWEADTGHEYLTLTGHTAAVTACIVARRFECLGVGVGRRDRASVGNGKRHCGQEMERQGARALGGNSRDGRIVTCGRDQITRIWDQDGKQLIETKPIGDVAVRRHFATNPHEPSRRVGPALCRFTKPKMRACWEA